MTMKYTVRMEGDEVVAEVRATIREGWRLVTKGKVRKGDECLWIGWDGSVGWKPAGSLCGELGRDVTKGAKATIRKIRSKR